MLLSTLLICSTLVLAEADILVKEPIDIPTGEKHLPGEILVKFKPGVGAAKIAEINAKHGASVLYTSPFAGFKRMRVPKGKTIEEMIKIYSKNPNVEYAEPNSICHASMVPNDPYYSYQWNLDQINMEAAWDIHTGSAGVTVAVLDTGVAYENNRNFKQAPDLAGTSFVQGYDFIGNDTHPNDDEGHGTHVTGTIAQTTNNNLGVAGIAFNCSIMPVKVLDKSGSGTAQTLADGLYYAADNGADVVNMSLGWDPGYNPGATVENAIAYAYNRGVTLVAASGNEEADVVAYPAAYDDYVIAVGATRYDEAVAYYSNTGTSLDLTAPGGDTTVDQNGDGYADGVLQQTFGSRPSDFGYWFYQGTSVATPHVVGVAALLISNGTTGPDRVREALENTASDRGANGWDPAYGWGIVDAQAALQYVGQPVHDVAVTNISAPSWCLRGDLVSIAVSVANPGDYSETFNVTLDDNTDAVGLGSQSVSLAAGASTTVTFTWDTTGSSLGDHVLEAVASTVAGGTNTANNSRSETVTVSEAVTMHVADIDMSLKKAGKNTSAIVEVAIADENGVLLSGATVTGDWTLNGGYLKTTSSATNKKGTAELSTGKVSVLSGDVLTFTITGVVKDGCIYDPASNVETSDSITVP